MDEFLDLQQLSQRRKLYLTSMKESFREVYKQCIRRIKFVTFVKNQSDCYFQPPVFILGKPLYDYSLLIKYLIKKLTSNGLVAQWDNEHQALYISWKEVRWNVRTNRSINQSKTALRLPGALIYKKPPSSKKGKSIWILEYHDDKGAIDYLPINLPKKRT